MNKELEYLMGLLATDSLSMCGRENLYKEIVLLLNDNAILLETLKNIRAFCDSTTQYEEKEIQEMKAKNGNHNLLDHIRIISNLEVIKKLTEVSQ